MFQKTIGKLLKLAYKNKKNVKEKEDTGVFLDLYKNFDVTSQQRMQEEPALMGENVLGEYVCSTRKSEKENV